MNFFHHHIKLVEEFDHTTVDCPTASGLNRRSFPPKQRSRQTPPVRSETMVVNGAALAPRRDLTGASDALAPSHE
ncbi:MAG: hypothetical protein OXC62_04035 [Aestuariivita sp.]|nr:hypothetical protein [Aestuariivita sp.]